MTSIDRIRLKVGRARKHISDLELELNAFFGTEPYKVGVKRDPKTRRLIYYLVGVAEVPEQVSLITADVLQNLGSALDHLAYGLLLVGTGGQPGNQAKRVFFPIEDDAAKYASESPRKLKGMTPPAIAAIDAVKPYKGGNDLLWEMNQLNRIGKHRFIVMAGSEFRSLDIGSYMLRNMIRDHLDPETKAALATTKMPLLLKPKETGFPLTRGYELFEDLSDAEVHEKMEFHFQVALKEQGVIDGEPLLETLRSMANMVDGLITDFASLLV